MRAPCNQVGGRDPNVFLAIVCLPREEVPAGWLHVRVEGRKRVTHILTGAAGATGTQCEYMGLREERRGNLR